MPSRFLSQSVSSESNEPLLNNMSAELESDAKDQGSPTFRGVNSLDEFSSVNNPPVGRDNLYDSTPPHASYEGLHRYDPNAKWTAEEEARVVRKTDLYLLTWICFMVRVYSCC